MSDKQFIGKVSEVKFSNGGTMLKLSLSGKDKMLLEGDGYTTILIKKSLKGTHYAEIDNWQPGQRATPTPETYGRHETRDEAGEDLPF